MPSRPDLRLLSSGVREAFAECDREALLDVLTFVVKEYVVDGPPPMMLHQVEQLADLRGLSFAQVIAALQTRLEHPELTQFVVDGEHVSVRVGGAMHPLVGGRTPLTPTTAPVLPPAADLPRPAAGVRVVEAQLPTRPPADAPRPTAGIALRGAPLGAGGPPPATPPASAASLPATAAQTTAAPEPAKPAVPGDDAAARFSLLELD